VGYVSVRKTKIRTIFIIITMLIIMLFIVDYMIRGITTEHDAGGKDSDFIGKMLPRGYTQYRIEIDEDVLSLDFAIYPKKQGKMEVFLYRGELYDFPYSESTLIRWSVLSDDIVRWNVGKEEIDSKYVTLIYDNTNDGELPHTNGLSPLTRTEVTFHNNPPYTPLILVVVAMAVLMIILVHHVYVLRKSG